MGRFSRENLIQEIDKPLKKVVRQVSFRSRDEQSIINGKKYNPAGCTKALSQNGSIIVDLVIGLAVATRLRAQALVARCNLLRRPTQSRRIKSQGID